ncbi:MAG: argininosuccinate lyase [Acidaminococcaceae bacterium]|nr:argininosuccinate lyase [Acidaminococcaceae bacterium]
MAKLWGGRFSKNTNELVDAFNASINYDKRLYREDIRGSIAHANMLVKCGIIPEADGVKIVAGLQDILKEIEAGNFEFSVALEDIHMNVEARLTEKIGDAGARLHTARSRNDQVALDMHMYMKRQLTEIAELLLEFERALLTVAKKHDKTLMPGYTHLQRAQPITFAHHLLAYFNMLQRDFRRLLGVWDDADIMPLGAGAIAGTTFPIDRFYVAEQLNFANVYANSMDAVSDRDYILNFLSFASVLMMHMSRLSEELCLWSSTEFGFIELDDAFATGSSMMPQKKNPDISELVRGKTGRVYGELMAMLTTLKGLPLTYNKDLQEDKEGLFDAIDTVKFTLQVYRDMIATMTVKTERMKWAVSHDFSNATDLADYLVRKGMPFRKAHAVVGQCVAYAIKEDKFLLDMTLEEYKRFSELFEPDLMQALDPEHCVNARVSYGGPSYVENDKQLEKGELILQAQEEKLKTLQEKI